MEQYGLDRLCHLHNDIPFDLCSEYGDGIKEYQRPGDV